MMPIHDDSFDFHIHTYYSDGDDSPEEVCRRAAREDIAHLSITDHDHMMPVEELRALAGETGVDLVPGCEISTFWVRPDGRKAIVHLGAHWVDREEPAMRAILEHNQSQPFDQYVRAMLIRCREAGIFPDDVDGALEQIIRDNPHSVHIGKRAVARFLVSRGYAASWDAAYQLFAPGGAARVEALDHLDYVPLEEAVSAIGRSGLCTLNHLFYSKLEEWENRLLLQDAVRLGVHGLETLYTRYDSDQRKYLYRAAKELGLLPNCGSDAHTAARLFFPGLGNMYRALRDRQLALHGTLNI